MHASSSKRRVVLSLYNSTYIAFCLMSVINNSVEVLTQNAVKSKVLYEKFSLWFVHKVVIYCFVRLRSVLCSSLHALQ